MKYYHEFKNHGGSFAERAGDPDKFFSAIGMIAISFAELDDQLSEAIVSLLGSQHGAGEIVVAELSFRAKVNLFASLVRQRAKDRPFNVGNAPVLEVLRDLCANVFKAEELRNTVMHSSWKGLDMPDDKIVRKKITAKSKQGFRITEQEVDIGHLLDIAEFTNAVATDVLGFMSEP